MPADQPVADKSADQRLTDIEARLQAIEDIGKAWRDKKAARIAKGIPSAIRAARVKKS